MCASAPAVQVSALPARHARNRGCTRARQDCALCIRRVSSANATAAVTADLPMASGEDRSGQLRHRVAGGDCSAGDVSPGRPVRDAEQRFRVRQVVAAVTAACQHSGQWPMR